MSVTESAVHDRAVAYDYGRMVSIGHIVAIVLALVSVIALAQLAWGALEIPSLADVPPLPNPVSPGAVAATGLYPRVSLIVAARDEERHVDAAVRSLLRQSYPDVQFIVVDDRSSDDTPRLLARLAAEDPRLQVVRIDTLPPGWLGKNHALHVGAQRADGELLLFADADVILQEDALARAVRLVRVAGVDHLAVAPDVVAPTAPVALVVNYFLMWFLLWFRPWRARNPKSAAYAGIGAFNLVRADAYRSIGGHARIALRPDDDIMLGKLLKAAGRAQLFADGDGIVRVEWYRSLGQLARGFRKNAFAGLHYSLALAAGAVIAQLLLAVWPFIAVALSTGIERALYASAAVAQMAAYAGTAVSRRMRPWLTPLYPVAAALFVIILAAAVARTVRQGGIEWRGTRYPLDALRANRV